MTSCFKLAEAKREQSCSNSRIWWSGFSLLNPEKESFRTIAIRSGKSSQLDVRIIHVDDGGSGNSSLGAERL
jgi:hypothetical protein